MQMEYITAKLPLVAGVVGAQFVRRTTQNFLAPKLAILQKYPEITPAALAVGCAYGRKYVPDNMRVVVDGVAIGMLASIADSLLVRFRVVS